MNLSTKQRKRIIKHLPEGYRKTASMFFMVSQDHIDEILHGVMIDKTILAYLVMLATWHKEADDAKEKHILKAIKALK